MDRDAVRGVRPLSRLQTVSRTPRDQTGNRASASSRRHKGSSWPKAAVTPPCFLGPLSGEKADHLSTGAIRPPVRVTTDRAHHRYNARTSPETAPTAAVILISGDRACFSPRGGDRDLRAPKGRRLVATGGARPFGLAQPVDNRYSIPAPEGQRRRHARHLLDHIAAHRLLHQAP